MKLLSIALAFVLIFCLVGCNTDRSLEDTNVISTENVVDNDVLKVWATYGFISPRPKNPNLEISQEQSDTIKDIWQRCEWTDNVTETAYDYIFVDGEQEIRYSYDEGIFNDVTNMKCALLSDEMHTEVNNVVDWLIVLPIID